MFSVVVHNGAQRLSLDVKHNGFVIASLSLLLASAGMQPTAPPVNEYSLLDQNGGKLEIRRK
jgi:hypothetical protein